MYICGKYNEMPELTKLQTELLEKLRKASELIDRTPRANYFVVSPQMLHEIASHYNVSDLEATEIIRESLTLK